MGDESSCQKDPWIEEHKLEITMQPSSVQYLGCFVEVDRCRIQSESEIVDLELWAVESLKIMHPSQIVTKKEL
jgi:hypothetical protein